MKWIVTGADRETGKARTIEIIAPTREEADRQANKLGLLTETLSASVATMPHPRSPAWQSAGQSSDTPPTSTPTGVLPSQPDAMQPIQNPYVPPRPEPPEYMAIGICASAARVLCILSMISGLVSFCMLGRVGFENSLLATASFETAAVVLWMLAEMSLALRDIARNSFGR